MKICASAANEKEFVRSSHWWPVTRQTSLQSYPLYHLYYYNLNFHLIGLFQYNLLTYKIYCFKLNHEYSCNNLTLNYNQSFFLQVVGLNFSSATSPELLLKTFDHYCEYRRTPNGVVLAPIQLNKWLVLFCDEINLPNMDKYGKLKSSSFTYKKLK